MEQWHADLYPGAGLSGAGSVTMSSTAKTAVNGQSVTIGRQNQVWKILVQ